MTVQVEDNLAARAGQEGDGPALCAVLLNPSFTGPNSVSHGNLRVAAEALGFSRVSTVNLVGVQTRNSYDLAELATMPAAWHSARPEIEDALQTSDHVLFGWGDSRLRGIANNWKQEQIEWTVGRAIDHGHEYVLMMDGKPRHPSRWRQYVGPQRGLFTGPSLNHRFAQALQLHRTDLVLGRRSDRENPPPLELLDIEARRFTRERTPA